VLEAANQVIRIKEHELLDQEWRIRLAKPFVNCSIRLNMLIDAISTIGTT
jgi:hypothetical protein